MDAGQSVVWGRSLRLRPDGVVRLILSPNAPFRKWIFYPALLKKIRATWDQNIWPNDSPVRRLVSDHFPSQRAPR